MDLRDVAKPDRRTVLLAELGYQVVCARSAPEAIQVLKSGKGFDLLFSDKNVRKGVGKTNARTRRGNAALSPSLTSPLNPRRSQ